MPNYEYVCTACGHRADILHGLNDPGPDFCPSCGREGTMRKQFALPAIHYKGSGWAKKDRSTKPSKPAGASEAGASEAGVSEAGASEPGASDRSGKGEVGDKRGGSAKGERGEGSSATQSGSAATSTATTPVSDD